MPGRPPAAEMVQGGQSAGEFERLVERGVGRGGQPQALGHRGERVEDGERLGAAGHVQVMDTALVFARPRPLGEEEEVEQPAFGGPGEVLEGGELDR